MDGEECLQPLQRQVLVVKAIKGEVRPRRVSLGRMAPMFRVKARVLSCGIRSINIPPLVLARAHQGGLVSLCTGPLMAGYPSLEVRLRFSRDYCDEHKEGLDLRCYIVKLRIQGCRYWV